MDPTNITPTLNPVPGAAPAAPVMPGQPMPQAAAQPVAPVETAADPAQQMPSAPVNPIINPAANMGTPNPINPAANMNAVAAPTPVNPGFRPTNIDGINGVPATDPIMVPAPAPEPDPIEEELKAPMKAAGPVPGSIGSAVSMPAPEGASVEMESFEMVSGGNTPSVSFADPAAQPDSKNSAQTAKPVKKKTSKGTLIALAIVLLLIAAALAVFLVMQLNGGM